MTAQTDDKQLLITAGPTHEPIDRVRFIGNRSSGRLGVALADEAAEQGWRVTLLLGPTHLTPNDSRISLVRFQTTAELEGLLEAHFDDADVLIMAAAVADYRARDARPEGKLSRGDGPLTLDLEPTPDLVAACTARRRPHQLVVGFALEPADRLLESAAAKLERKGLDMIVANPLDTMESDHIDATILTPEGAHRTGPIAKRDFAGALLELVGAARRQRHHHA